MQYIVEHHQPGCLPDGEPSTHDDPAEAIEAWLEEIREAVEELPSDEVTDEIRYDGEVANLERLAATKGHLTKVLVHTGSVAYPVDSYIYEVSRVAE